MSRVYAVVLCACLIGCGSDRSPVGPSPLPAPATFTGSVTDTVTGAPVAGFTALVAGSRLTVSAPGYVTRETRASAPSVDIIPEVGFDLEFYRQLARGAMEGQMHGLKVLWQSPNIYLQTDGLSPSNVAALEQAARAVVPAMTGGRFQVQVWETGQGRRQPLPGWIAVAIVNNDSEACGRGLAGGSVMLNISAHCQFQGYAVYPGVLAHEIGHVLGFEHVDRPGSMMRSGYESAQPTDLERRHASIAYHRPRGNNDIDVDP